MRILPSALLALCLLAGPAAADEAAEPRPAASSEAGAADKLRLLFDLVQDPQVRAVLDVRRPAREESKALGDTMTTDLGTQLKELRDHILGLASAVPRLPGEFAHARLMLDDMLGHGDALSLALFVALFIALGFGGEWLFRVSTRGLLVWLLALPLHTVKERVSAVFARFAWGLGLVASYALGSIGAMLPFDLTAGFKQVLLGLLLASLITRLCSVVGRFLLAPGASRFRIVPVGSVAASFLFRRLVAAGLLLGIGTPLATLLDNFGFDATSQELCRDAIETLGLLLGLATVLPYPGAGAPDAAIPAQGPHTIDTPPGPPADAIASTPTAASLQAEPSNDAVAPASPHSAEWRRLRAAWARVGLALSLVLLWCFALTAAHTAFWVLLFTVGGPCAVVVAQRSIRHVMRPAGLADGARADRLEVVFLERGVRTLMIVGAAAWLAHLIGLDVAGIAMSDTVPTRISRAVIGVMVVVLVADLLWHVIVAVIDRKLAITAGSAAGHDAGAHAARLQTLLPITRNLSLAALVTVAGTMVLASLGVEIGPLIASAGVFGVAIGFGAQTLVKDIISGIFYLVDDAFRIGEYIQSGSYKGTVESFSLRSVKLRHQRGALYTIPFGTLGAVQNLSRDWVVDKILVNVPYDTDLDRVRKIMKGIGGTLAADAELGPDIIHPIKLQGVAQFGDYAIQLQTKMTTKPGDIQFAARRRALLMIKSEFQAHGIGFALPTVQVSGEGSGAAVAQRALSLVTDSRAGAAE